MWGGKLLIKQEELNNLMRDRDQLNQSSTIATNPEAQGESQRLAWTIAQAASELQAEDIVLLQVTEVSYLADYFILATGNSKTQVRAISDAIQAKVASQTQQHPVRMEGQAERNWILQDYGDAIAHILLPEEREFYNIEAFWGHAERIDFQST